MKLTKRAHEALRGVTAAAEKRTSARIAVVTVPVSDRYDLYPLVFGAVVGFLVFSVLAGFFHHLALREAFLITAAVAGAATLALEIMTLRLMIVPRHAKNWECWELAHRAFASRILAQNDRKTGICLFVSLGERYVEVVTDRDVDLHIPQTIWDAIIQEFLAEAKQGRLGTALPKAVDACATVLAQYYPPV